MDSQASVSSAASTVPLDLINDQDNDFVDEIDEVDRIYFGNIEINLRDDISYSDLNDEDDEDCESDKENIDSNTSNIGVECSELDLCESEKQTHFLNQTCNCERLYNKVPCSKIVDNEVLIDYRLSCLEMDKSELDLTIKVQLFAHRNNSTGVDAKKHKDKERERIMQQYFFNGHQICRKTFLFAHAIGKSQLESISKSLEREGLKPRTHGNTGKTPKHALSMTDIQRVKHFLNEYAVKFGVPLPGRLPNHRNLKVTLLPSDKTKADIHQIYQEAAKSLNYRVISLSEFKQLWLEQCPQIILMKPATDLCSTCQGFTVSLSKTGNLQEEEKALMLQKYGDHLEKAKKQRDYYRDQCQESKENFTNLSQNQRMRGQPGLSYDGTMHYSFDYAQQIHYPHYSQQVGPLFFKTPRKCQCFGVCAEGSGTQVFYLVDESEETGKGANSVISMLHHHFQYKSYGETAVKLHMDNCTGQNKNNFVIWYGIWRVLTGLHNSVEFNCMETGHTKFHPDWHFGLWKVKWRHYSAETLQDIAQSVTDSSRNNHNIPQLVQDEGCPVKFYDWKTFLKQFFKPLSSLTTYHHFRADKESPGIIFVKEYCDSLEKEFMLLKKRVVIDSSMPSELPRKGLDAMRQWYLYQEIRPLCYDNKDITCPKPTVPKPDITIVEHVDKTRKCSYCKETGHEKNKNGEILCPMMPK